MRDTEYYKAEIHEMVDKLNNRELISRFYTILKYSTKKPGM